MSNYREKCVLYIRKNVDIFLMYIIVCGIIFYFSLFGIDPLHQGLILKTAGDVADGLTLFKETYTQHGSLPIYIQAFAILLGGKSIWVINLATILFEGVAYIFLYKIITIYKSKIWGWTICALTLSLGYFYFWEYHPWSSVYAMAFMLGGCYYIQKYIISKETKYILPAGIFTALTLWCRLPVGLVFLLAMLIIMSIMLVYSAANKTIKRWVKDIAFFVGVMLGVHAVFIVIILVQGSFEDWYKQFLLGAVSFMNSRTGEASAQRGFVRTVLSFLIPKLWYNPIWYVVPIFNLGIFISIVIYYIVMLVIKKKFLIGHREVAFLSWIVVATASWHQYYPVVCYRHLYWGFLPMLGIFTISIDWLFQKLAELAKIKKRISFLGVGIILIILMFPEWKDRIEQGYEHLSNKNSVVKNIEYPLVNNLRLESEQAVFYNDLFTTIEEVKELYPDKNIMNKTTIGLFSCFHIRNITSEFMDRGSLSFYEDANEIKAQYVREEGPIIIGYTDHFRHSGYRLYKELDGNSGDIYTGDSGIGIFVPIDEETVDITNLMCGSKELTDKGYILEPKESINGPAAKCHAGSYSFIIQCEIPQGEKVGCVVYADGEEIAGQNLVDGSNEIKFSVSIPIEYLDISIYNVLDENIAINSVAWRQSLFTEEKWERGVEKIKNQYPDSTIINATKHAIKGSVKCNSYVEGLRCNSENVIVFCNEPQMNTICFQQIETIGGVNVFAPYEGCDISIFNDIYMMNDVEDTGRGYKLNENGILHGPYIDFCAGKYRVKVVGDYNGQQLGYSITLGEEGMAVQSGIVDVEHSEIEINFATYSENFNLILHNAGQESVLVKDILVQKISK